MKNCIAPHTPTPVKSGPLVIAPLDCDEWIASSALQATIRRGDVLTAQRAAVTLHDAVPGMVWFRLLMSAVEDVGVANVDAVVATVARASKPSLRKRLGGDLPAILETTRLLATSLKSRSADHLISVAVHDRALAELRIKCWSDPLDAQIEAATDPASPLSDRAVAAWYASGLRHWRDRNRRGGSRGGLLRLLAGFGDLGVPAALLDAVRIAARTTGYPVVIMLPLLWLATAKSETRVVRNRLSSAPTVNGVPLYALDAHNDLGRIAIALFARQTPEIANLLSVCVPRQTRARVVELAVFHADCWALRQDFACPESRQLKDRGMAADFHSANAAPPVGEVMVKRVRQHLDRLNAIRAELLRLGAPPIPSQST